MSFRILIVCATNGEAEALRKLRHNLPSSEEYSIGRIEMSILVTGVGSMATAWEMTKWFSSNPEPDLALNIGIAGSYNKEIGIGEVVIPFSDCFADSGIEDGENYLTLFDAGLARENDFPFKEGLLPADTKFFNIIPGHLKQVRSITVNTSTGSDYTRNKLIKKFNPDIETMEGATFFYICIRKKIPFLAIRSISNMVEPRNRDNWNIPLALYNLSEKLNEVILTMK
jgi:futalosine hydrolase